MINNKRNIIIIYKSQKLIEKRLFNKNIKNKSRIKSNKYKR